MFSRTMLRRTGLALSLSVLSAALLVPTAFGQQQGRTVTINQISNLAWPDVTVNMSLKGPDGKAVTDVNPAQFAVTEQGAPQIVTGLELGAARSVPLTLVLAMDVSGSMNANGKIEQAKAAAAEFLNSLRPEDNGALLAFSDQVRTVVPMTADRGALQAGVNALQATGNTAIYDALYRSSEILNSVPKDRRRAVVLLTDGADTSSKYSSVVASNVARDTGALVYTIGLGPDANDAALTSLAQPAGGKYYKAPAPADLKGIYNAITLELDSQLFLKYKSNSKLERAYQLITLEIKYTAPDGQVITKSVRYRPPASALPASSTVSQAAPSNPAGAQLVVPLPSGLQQVGMPSSRRRLSAAGSAMVTGAAILTTLALFLVVLALTAYLTPSPVTQRVASYVAGQAPIVARDRPPGFFSRVIIPGLERAGRTIARISPRGYTEHVEHLLTLTGPPYRMRLGQFLGIQLAASVAAVLLLLFWTLQTASDAPSQWLLAVMLGVAIGAYFPYFWLKRRVTRRQKALLRALPGALDFLAINVEAGLGFDAALAQVTQRWQNTLTDEFSLLLIDFQIGKPRKDAWRELIARTQVPELTAFITAMLQNEQIGASIGLLLRTQADQMRVRRRQVAEESARTAPVKMLLPMVFFIFPGIFVVILGPSVPQFLGTFVQLGR